MNSDPRAVQEALTVANPDGTVYERFNLTTGKWENPKVKRPKQRLAFDPKTKKLCLAPEDVDNVLPIGMAQDGFFVDLKHFNG